MNELKVGQTIWVQLDDDNVYADEWTEVKITSIEVLHNKRVDPVLDPYVCVGVEHERLQCFNYTMYCYNDHVRLEVPE